MWKEKLGVKGGFAGTWKYSGEQQRLDKEARRKYRKHKGKQCEVEEQPSFYLKVSN